MKNSSNIDATEELTKVSCELQQAQQQLLQSEKMAAIGQLAAGVAHEINNPIGFLISNMNVLERYVRNLVRIVGFYEEFEGGLSAGHRRVLAEAKQDMDWDYLKADIFSLLSESEDGLARVRKIVQDLKDFSHAGVGEWQLADLHLGLDSTLNIVANELKYKATITKEYGDLPQVECLPTELNQVFMNLLVNAGQAIAEQGKITLRTVCVGDEVCVEISDTGAGIEPESLSRIFEPFFTTKPVGQGTGLGLSLSYSIVQKHHGHIEVDSELGRGTTFRIRLPVRQPEEGVEASVVVAKQTCKLPS